MEGSDSSLPYDHQGEVDSPLIFEIRNTPGGKENGGIQVWKILISFLGLALFCGAGSMIICATSDRCRNHIPTVSNLLNNTLTAPFITSGIMVGFGSHLIIIAALAFCVQQYAPYWGSLQLLCGFLIYFCAILTLFIFPFTGWENNWAHITIMITFLLWMLLAQIALMRGLKNARAWPFIFIGIYLVSIIPYIVVSAVPNLPIEGKDIGILVCWIVSLCSAVTYIIICFLHIRNVSIHFFTPRNPNHTD